MAAAAPIVAIRTDARPAVVPRLFDASSIPPRLVTRDAPAPLRRSKIWEFSTHLHCSIIGTCLSTHELRQILKKLGVATQGSTDHALHGIAVTLSARHDDASRQLHKALDHRHKLAVHQFAKATNEAELHALWAEALRRGEVPGAFWATLTHAAATQAIIREAFGDVHMLSHLIGSANRADIRRLCQLEAEKAALEAKLHRQQAALHEAVVSRDARIADLRQALTQRVMTEPQDGVSDERAALRGLVRDLERRLAAEFGRQTAMRARATAAQAAVTRERSARIEAERDRDAMRCEVDAINASFTQEVVGEPPGITPAVRLDGIVLLYVGGRPAQLPSMRTAIERLGATFLHHDGGIENHPSLLAGLVSRSDVVVFPIDCISHDAANTVKSLCRHGHKRFIPLRSASLTSLLAFLATPEMAESGGA